MLITSIHGIAVFFLFGLLERLSNDVIIATTLKLLQSQLGCTKIFQTETALDIAPCDVLNPILLQLASTKRGLLQKHSAASVTEIHP